MTSLVMDISVALAAILPERQSDLARLVLLRVADRGAVVPATWHLEIGNALLAAERRRFLEPAQLEEALRHIAALPISIDAETGERALGDTMRLARDYGLSLHDAAYLELALRRGIMLVSFDAALRRAGQVAGARGAADV